MNHRAVADLLSIWQTNQRSGLYSYSSSVGFATRFQSLLLILALRDLVEAFSLREKSNTRLPQLVLLAGKSLSSRQPVNR